MGEWKNPFRKGDFPVPFNRLEDFLRVEESDRRRSAPSFPQDVEDRFTEGVVVSTPSGDVSFGEKYGMLFKGERDPENGSNDTTNQVKGP